MTTLQTKILKCSFLLCVLLLPFANRAQAQRLPGADANNNFTGFNTFPSVNNVLYLDGIRFTTADIGATLNEMYAILPYDSVSRFGGGKIIIPPNPTGDCYTTSTPIVFGTLGKVVMLEGAVSGGGDPSNPGPVCINYVPTTPTAAITLDWGPSVSPSNPGGGLRDISVINNNCDKAGGCSSSATGVEIAAKNYGAAFASFQNVVIAGFGKGIQQNSGQSWGMSYSNVVLRENDIGYSETTPVETSDWFGGVFLLNGTHVYLANNSLFKAVNTHFDSSTGIGISAKDASVELTNPHFENYGETGNTHYFYGSNLHISGGEALEDASSGTKDYWFATDGLVNIDGLAMSSAGATVTNLVVIGGQATMFFRNVTSSILNPCPSVTNTSICGQVADSGKPFLNVPRLGLGTTEGAYNITPMPESGGNTATFPNATGTVSFARVEYCGATSGSIQPCARTVQYLSTIVFGDVILNGSSFQLITRLPFTQSTFSCSGSDLTNPAAVVSFTNRTAFPNPEASVLMIESGGGTSDQLTYQCVGY